MGWLMAQHYIGLEVGGGVKGERGRCRENHGREGWVGDIYGGGEGRRNIRGREG